MKKYLVSGFNTVQDVKLEAGTYTIVAYAKSMYSNVYTFALGDGVNWTEYDIDVVKGQLCKVWLTFTIDKKVTKFKPIANNFSESLPVYVTDLQLTRGNMPVEAGANPYDVKHDYESKIEQAANKISLAIYDKNLDDLDPQTEIKLTSDGIILTVANELLDTGIDINSKQITLTANNTIFKNNSEQPIALFNSDWTKINADVIELTANDQITLKVNGLKTDLSDTGIDIEEGKLTLYSGAKDSNAGGQVIIAGSNFSVDANGKIKAVDGEFSGKIASGGGISTIGDKIKLNSDGSGQLAGGNIKWNDAGNTEFLGGVKSPFTDISDATVGSFWQDEITSWANNFFEDQFTNVLIIRTIPCRNILNGQVFRIHALHKGIVLKPEEYNGFYENGTLLNEIQLNKGDALEMVCICIYDVFHSWDIIRRYKCRPYDL